MTWLLVIGAAVCVVVALILAQDALREGKELSARIDADRERFLGDTK